MTALTHERCACACYRAHSVVFRWWLKEYSRDTDAVRRALLPHWSSAKGQDGLVTQLRNVDKEGKGTTTARSFRRVLARAPSVFTPAVVDCLIKAGTRSVSSQVNFAPFLKVRGVLAACVWVGARW